MGISWYFDKIQEDMKKSFAFANNARKSGVDPADEVEILLASNMAERVVGLISSVAPQIKGSGVIERILELEKEYGVQDTRVALKAALEVAQQKFCTFKDKREAMEVGMRVGLAYLTNGVVGSPLEGFVQLKLRKRRDGNGEYFALYFSGPIRSAGTTAASLFVVLCDYIRINMGYATYDPSEEEVKRMVTELYDYHEKVTNLQYLPSEEEIIFMVEHLPVQIDGDASEKYDVSNYKGLERIEVNKIRNGPCLTLGEGLCQKASKVYTKKISPWIDEFGLKNWHFLKDFVALQRNIRAKTKEIKQDGTAKIKPDYAFIKDVVAGRPVLTHPLRCGGFRLRYGRARNSGFSAQAVHPATMVIVDSFVAVGTQLKVERPGKSSVIASCDTVEGPIVKLKDGSVLFVEDEQTARKIVDDVSEIIYLGDLLINYGDFLNRGHVLVPVGYNEDYWMQETGVKQRNIPVEEAISLCHQGNPLHPRYTYHWNSISKEQLKELLQWLLKSTITENKVILPLEQATISKRVLELIGVPHRVVMNEHVVIEGEWARALLFSLGGDFAFVDGDSVLDIVNKKAGCVIRDKDGTYIGARMGRPEKAKMRKLKGSPQVLFPVGKEGGRMRSFQSALEKGGVTSQFALLRCGQCKHDTLYRTCEDCGQKTEQLYACTLGIIKPGKCHHEDIPYNYRKIDLHHYFDSALKTLNLQIYPELIKGVRGTMNDSHIPEHLTKGILRAMHNLYVNKDGTIRYDMTEMPLTHFKPKEIGTSVEKLKELGYANDIYGSILENEGQILELLPQDVVLPASPDSPDEGADVVLFNIGRFIDTLLEKVYKAEPFYKFKNKQDVVGSLVVGLSPHTSAGIVGRVIGFSKVQVLYAHPYFHSIMRRDCVYPNTKLLFFDNNNTLFYPKIGGFVDELIKKGCKTKILDAVGTISVTPDKEYYTYGADPKTKNLVKKRIKYFIKGPVNKQWIKVKTATNRELTMTFNHDFMCLDDQNNIQFKKAKDILVGDRLLVMDFLKPQINKNTTIDLLKEFLEKLPEEALHKVRVVDCPDFFKGLVSKIGKKNIFSLIKISKRADVSRWCNAVPLDHVRILLANKLVKFVDLPQGLNLRYWFSRQNFSRILKVNEDLCRLLGYYTAAGHCRENKTTRQVSFRICNLVLKGKVIDCIRSCFSLLPAIEENETKLSTSYALIYYIFKYVLSTGTNAKNKKIPSLMYSLPDNLVLEYVSAYVDGDCSIVPERGAISFYSTNRSLLDDFALLLSRFHIIGRYRTIKKRFPGKKLLERYAELGLPPKKFGLYHLVFNGIDCMQLGSKLKLCHLEKILKLRKLLSLKVETRLLKFNHKYYPLHSFGDSFIDYVKNIEIVNSNTNSYCVEVEWKKKEERSVVWGEQIINTRCDGDESCVIMLMDAFLNFSNYYLSSHRGAKQDEPLVLTSVLVPKDVDDMVFDMDIADHYPAELYKAAQEYKQPWEVKIPCVKDYLGTERESYGFMFTHDTDDINNGVRCSSYKFIPTMQEKVEKQMDVAEKIRAVDQVDVARLIIERHFIRDIKGNLRKFSSQQFRCVNCNEKYRRPPLQGKCITCDGKIIFTIAEGSIVKYLEPSLALAKKYELSPYLRQTLEITKARIESIFGKPSEKQEGLGKWF